MISLVIDLFLLGPSCAELSQLHKHFPDVFTGEELEEGSGGPFNSNFNCLSVRNVAIAYPSVHLLDEFRLATEVIGDKEPCRRSRFSIAISKFEGPLTVSL